VKLGKSFSFKQDMILALVQAPYKAGTEIVSGATVGKATVSGALKLTGPAINSIFKNLEKAPMPIVITYGGKDVAAKFISKMVGTLVQKRGIEDYGKSKILTLWPSDTADDHGESPLHRNGQVVAEATLNNKYLLYLAFVNQEKGIGRGW
jgi:hypothetical protein